MKLPPPLKSIAELRCRKLSDNSFTAQLIQFEVMGRRFIAVNIHFFVCLRRRIYHKISAFGRHKL